MGQLAVVFYKLANSEDGQAKAAKHGNRQLTRKPHFRPSHRCLGEHGRVDLRSGTAKRVGEKLVVAFWVTSLEAVEGPVTEIGSHADLAPQFLRDPLH
jgi:hypothetical protein